MSGGVIHVSSVFDNSDLIRGVNESNAKLKEQGEAAKGAGEVGSAGLQKLAAAAGNSAGTLAKNAQEWKDGFKVLGEGIKAAGGDVEGFQGNANKAIDALKELGRAGDSPAAIERAALKAAAAMAPLKQTLLDAAQAGVKMGPEVVGALDTIGGAVTQAVAKSKDLRAAFAEASDQIKRLVDPETAGRLGRISDELQKSAGSSKALRSAADAVTDALRKLAAADGPRAATRAIAEGKEAADKYRTALEQAKAAGQNISGNAPQALDALDRQLKSSTYSLGQQRDSMGDTRREADLAAEAHKLFGNKLDGVLPTLSKWIERTDAMASFTAKLAPIMGSVAAAFTVGWKTGTFLDEKLKDVGIDLGKMGSDAMDFVKGGGAQYPKTLGEWNVVINKSLAAKRQLRDAIESTAAKVKESIPEWKTNLEVQKEMAAKVSALNKEFVAIRARHGDWTAEVRANVAALVALGDQTEKEKGSLAGLPPALQQAILLARGMADADDHAAKKKDLLKQATEGFGKSLRDVQKNLQDSTAASQAEASATLSSIDAKLKALNGLELDEETYYREKKKLEQEEVDAILKSASQESEARAKATAALQAYAKEHGLSAKQVDELVQREAALAQSQGDVTKQMQPLVDALNKLVDKLGGTSANAGDANKAIADLAGPIANAAAPTSALASGIADIHKSAQDAKTSVPDLAGSFRELGSAATEAA